MIDKPDWITLDYLEIYCRNKHLAIGCRTIEYEFWISPAGSEPNDLSSDEVRQLLSECNSFEVRTISQLDDSEDEAPAFESAFLSRDELQRRLSRLLN